MKKEIQPKPLHEVILEMFYFESKDKPCRLTKNEVFWKFKDPSVSEFQIDEVLNWMVHNKKLNEDLGYYTLDKYEALEIEEKLKTEREETKKASSSLFYPNNYSLYKPKISMILVHYILPTLLISYVIFIFFLVQKLNNSYELKTEKIENVSGLAVAEPKTDYIRKNKMLSDKEVKILFKNQHENIVYLNKSMDSLQKQVTKLNEMHSKSVTVINSHFNNVQNQVNTILFHTIILLFLFILLFFIEFLLQMRNNSILLYKFTS
jgi:hypothetical protein